MGGGNYVEMTFFTELSYQVERVIFRFVGKIRDAGLNPHVGVVMQNIYVNFRLKTNDLTTFIYFCRK